MKKMQIDDVDRRILRHYLKQSRLDSNALADLAGVTPVTLWRRLQKLRQNGVIKSETARINWQALGYGVEVSLRFTLDKTNSRAFDEFIAGARLVHEVISIETFLGRVDVRLNVIARDMVHYQKIYRTDILTLPHISEVEALMLVATIKDEGSLAL